MSWSQPPEIIRIGLLGTNIEMYQYLSDSLEKVKSNDSLFECTKLKEIDENSLQNTLNFAQEILTS